MSTLVDRTTILRTVVFGCVMIWSLAAAAQSGPKRIDFDERLIKGQTAKAGAVYIFDRQKLGTQQLVNRNRSFRLRTIQTVFYDAKE